jgi:subtilisin family serine protease
MYPAAYPEVLGVAGTTSTDSLYSWSSYGSWVKVAAPGCDYTTFMGGSYGTFCGTSAAAPVVSGIVGLLRAANPAASNTQIEAAIESTCVPIGSAVQYGRVDAAGAIAALVGGTAPAPSPTPTVSPSPSPPSSPSPSPSVSPTPSASTTPKAHGRGPR